MATNKVKNLKKTDWQNIAKSLKIKFEKENVVRYLVEKIAEKHGIDDKIVKLDDLKQEVHDDLTKRGIVDAETGKLKAKKSTAKKPTAKKDTKKSATKKSTAKKPTAKKEDKKKEEPKIEVPEKSRLEQLRDRCTELGLAYGSAHTEQDLENLVNAVGGGAGVGATPNAPQDRVVSVSDDTKTDEETPESEDVNLTMVNADAQTAFAIAKGKEQFGELFDENSINGSHDPMASEPRFIFIQATLKNGKGAIFNLMAKEWKTKDKIPVPTPQIKSQPVTQHEQVNIPTVVHPVTQVDPSEVEMKELRVYRDVFMGAIKGHFRAMSKSEILGVLSMEKYPFTYQVNHNKENGSLVEIILTSKGNSLRLPSENTNEWISISG